jgi:hypothetical protein
VSTRRALKTYSSPFEDWYEESTAFDALCSILVGELASFEAELGSFALSLVFGLGVP